MCASHTGLKLDLMVRTAADGFGEGPIGVSLLKL